MGICSSNQKISNTEKKSGIPENITVKDCPTFIPHIEQGRVIQVDDCDTITIATKISNLENSLIYRFEIRLSGIDTPEIKSKNHDEKEIAKLVQQKLHNKIIGKIVQLKNINIEKSSRLLAEVYFNDIFINKWLIETNCAVEYDGGTKQIVDWKTKFEG